jgi:hypothetical protein
MNKFQLLYVIFLILLGCNKTKCPINEGEWELYLKNNSKNNISFIQYKAKSIGVMWDGKISNYPLPIEELSNLKQIENGLKGSFKIKDTIIDEMVLKRIVLNEGSFMDFADECGIINAEVYQTNTALLGNKIFIGMSKKDFLLLFFKSYNNCFDPINCIIFLYGMKENGISFIFKNGHLYSIILNNNPN